MIPVNPESVFCDTADEGAALGLFGLMTGLSEEFWCASWLTGLEHSLWQAAHGGRRRFGLGELTERQCTLLRLLGEESGGWWIWDESRGVAESGPKFVMLAEWVAQTLPASTSSLTPSPQDEGRSPSAREAPDEQNPHPPILTREEPK